MLDQITIEWLREQDACNSGVVAFRRIFGESAELTRENLLEAAAAGLEMDWLAGRLAEDRQRYLAATVVAYGDYEAARDLADAARREAWNAAWQAYESARDAAVPVLKDPAWTVYTAAQADRTQAYTEAINEAHAAYRAASANILADVLGLP